MLQNFIFPKKGICEETALYYHIHKGKAVLQEEGLFLERGALVDFFSYFNSFSAGKWWEYTTVRHTEAILSCRGRHWISLYRTRLNRGTLYTEKVAEGADKICFRYDSPDWVYYIEVEAQEDMIIRGGGYQVNETVEKRLVNLAIGICTYHREEYVQKTIRNLSDHILEKRDSELYGHVHVFVSDNGSTLSKEELNSEFVHVVYNKNAGGAGGFGRCMLETMKMQEPCGFTHILLMDDDVILEPETVFRTCQILSLLKEQYQGHLLGGGLLRLDIPYIQHENGAQWQGDRILFPKQGYDLSERYDIVANEERGSVNYCGWWYCCIPIKQGFEHALPMPFFIHRDDVEYGLRYRGRIITLNGISVWHDAFDHRRASSMVYYDIRNALICNAIHYPEYSAGDAKKYVTRNMIGHLLKYRYEDQKLTLRALEDFCRGTAFLSFRDPVELHQEIAAMGYKQTDVSALLEKYRMGDFFTRLEPKDLYKRKSYSLARGILLNGWFLPGKRKCIPIPFGAPHKEFFRCKRVLLFDPDSKQGFLAERKWKQFFVTIGRCFRAGHIIRKSYKRAAEDWRENGRELTTEEFWERYLE